MKEQTDRKALEKIIGKLKEQTDRKALEKIIEKLKEQNGGKGKIVFINKPYLSGKHEWVQQGLTVNKKTIYMGDLTISGVKLKFKCIEIFKLDDPDQIFELIQELKNWLKK